MAHFSELKPIWFTNKATHQTHAVTYSRHAATVHASVTQWGQFNSLLIKHTISGGIFQFGWLYKREKII